MIKIEKLDKIKYSVLIVKQKSRNKSVQYIITISAHCSSNVMDKYGRKVKGMLSIDGSTSKTNTKLVTIKPNQTKMLLKHAVPLIKIISD